MQREIQLKQSYLPEHESSKFVTIQQFNTGEHPLCLSHEEDVLTGITGVSLVHSLVHRVGLSDLQPETQTGDGNDKEIPKNCSNLTNERARRNHRLHNLVIINPTLTLYKNLEESWGS